MAHGALERSQLSLRRITVVLDVDELTRTTTPIVLVPFVKSKFSVKKGIGIY